jgi:hypothetical protein
MDRFDLTDEERPKLKLVDPDDELLGPNIIDEFPDVDGVSAEEFLMMDMRFWMGLRDSMSDGRSWAFKQYAAVRFKETKDPDAILVDMEELRSFLRGGSAASRWKTSEG